MFFPHASGSLGLSKSGACEALLKALPRPTGILELDARETSAAYSQFRFFRRNRLGHARLGPEREDAPGTLAVYRPGGGPLNLESAARRIRLLEKDFEEVYRYPRRHAGRVFEDPSDMLMFVARFRSLMERVSNRDHRQLSHELRWYAATGAAGLGLIGADLLTHGELHLSAGGIAALLFATAAGAKAWAKYHWHFGRVLLHMQRIAVDGSPRDWLYVHAENRVPRSILQASPWGGQMSESLGDHPYVAVDILAYVNDLNGDRRPCMVTFVRFRENPKKKPATEEAL